LGLEPALEALVSELSSKWSLEIGFKVVGAERKLSNDVNLALYRITQEALNNIWKHSRATKADVSLEYSPDKIKLSVSDKGIGFNSSTQIKGGLGLTGMRERANLIGAKMKIESAIGKGTTVLVEVDTPPHPQ
jgi:two-component system, NarL family, sensor histidine kinase DegS